MRNARAAELAQKRKEAERRDRAKTGAAVDVAASMRARETLVERCVQAERVAGAAVRHAVTLMDVAELSASTGVEVPELRRLMRLPAPAPKRGLGDGEGGHPPRGSASGGVPGGTGPGGVSG